MNTSPTAGGGGGKERGGEVRGGEGRGGEVRVGEGREVGEKRTKRSKQT